MIEVVNSMPYNSYNPENQWPELLIVKFIKEAILRLMEIIIYI